MKKILLLLLSSLLLLVGCQSNPDELRDGDARVFVTIDATNANAGILLSETEVLLRENETIYDVLLRVQRLYNLAVSEEVGPYGNYITAIGSVKNGDISSVSGWTYQVNGQEIWEACDDYVLQNGDCVLWCFVTSFS